MRERARTESELQSAIRLALGRVEDLTLWRNNIGTAERGERRIAFGVGGPGGADLIGLYRGRFVAVEIKRPGGAQTEEQLRFEQLVRRKGGEYAVLRSVDEAIAWLEGMRRRHG